MRSRHFSFTLIGWLLTAVMAAPATHPRYGGRLKLHLPVRPATLDPATCHDGGDVPTFDLLYRRLFEYGDDGRIESSFLLSFRREADRWILVPRPTPAAGGRVIGADEIRRAIEGGLKHGGFPATMARRMLVGGQEFASGQAALLSSLTQQPDGTLVLQTAGVQPLLPHFLARAPFYVAAEAEGQFYGNGPFMVANEAEEGALVLAPNPANSHGEPYVERLRVVWRRSQLEPLVEIFPPPEAQRATAGEPLGAVASRGIPRTLLLVLNPSKVPFGSADARRDFISSVGLEKLSLSPELGALKKRCGYLPSQLGSFPTVAALAPTETPGPGSPVRIIMRRGDVLGAAEMVNVFQTGIEFEELDEEQLSARMASGDYQACLLAYEHRFFHPVLDLMEMLDGTGIVDPSVLDATNQLAEAARLDDQSAAAAAVLAAEKSIAESGVIFPLAEISPAVRVDGRLRGLELDMRWNPVLDDCWIAGQ